MEPIKAYLSEEGWKRDWERTKSQVQALGRILYDSFVGDSVHVKEKESFLDLLDAIEERSTQWQIQLRREGKVFTAEGKVVVVRPDLAYPDVYATAPSQPLETRVGDVNNIYR